MSLFQCAKCGCIENTARTTVTHMMPELFNWDGLEEYKGKQLCSACVPLNYRDGTSTKLGKWHNRFTRAFVEKGKWSTNKDGNVEHIDTGDENFYKEEYAMFLTKPVNLTGKVQKFIDMEYISVLESVIMKCLLDPTEYREELNEVFELQKNIREFYKQPLPRDAGVLKTMLNVYFGLKLDIGRGSYKNDGNTAVLSDLEFTLYDELGIWHYEVHLHEPEGDRGLGCGIAMTTLSEFITAYHSDSKYDLSRIKLEWQ